MLQQINKIVVGCGRAIDPLLFDCAVNTLTQVKTFVYLGVTMLPILLKSIKEF